MASSEDKNFKRGFDSICSIGRSKAQMSVGKILGTISSAASHNSQSHRHQDDGDTFFLEKRALLNIDLNVAPPEDGGSAATDGGNCEEIRPGSVNEHDLNFKGNRENKDVIEAHWRKGEDNGFCVVKDEKKEMKSMNIAADSEERDRKIRRWNTLLEVSDNALLEHQQKNLREELQNRKRKTSEEAELGGELTRKKMRRSLNDESETPVVVRSTRGRALAMPNKYRDSVLDAVAELPRHNKTGKSATKRKSR